MHFLVDDFFKRAKDTITALCKSDENQNSKYAGNSDFTHIRDWCPCHNLEESLDPVNAILLTREFIEQKFVKEEQLPEALIGFFDINLVYCTILMRNDVGSIREDLLNHMIYLVGKIRQNLEHFRGKTELLTKLLTNKLLKIQLPRCQVEEMK